MRLLLMWTRIIIVLQKCARMSITLVNITSPSVVAFENITADILIPVASHDHGGSWRQGLNSSNSKLNTTCQAKRKHVERWCLFRLAHGQHDEQGCSTVVCVSFILLRTVFSRTGYIARTSFDIWPTRSPLRFRCQSIVILFLRP